MQTIWIFAPTSLCALFAAVTFGNAISRAALCTSFSLSPPPALLVAMQTVGEVEKRLNNFFIRAAFHDGMAVAADCPTCSGLGEN
jgi:sulfite exporter TauE/SafE